jgi:hypothetical protein
LNPDRGVAAKTDPLDLLDAEPAGEDAGILQALMNARHADLVEFLGGSR